MGLQVTAGSMLQCTFGVAPSSLTVLPTPGVMAGAPAATVMDYVPMLNVMPFGMCSCTGNPMVIAATAAALGALTPMACIPATAAPWAPGSPTVLIGNLPALNNDSKLMCMWGGVISITTPAQFTTQIP
ncbi:DUF4280 domain-containing protein [Paraburkholderia sp.]|uniref:DUF4280 domain-containing protein n=1 Tax=Paraburkholderia sp. TaxID=1926495 RepID=UPI00239262F7|nr:DUF4280 domain-containing protein [Paraburkholderia sp.]MDE1180913.1 DUF4280 domain-containing protein [Paraburkholderia sp.]